MPRPETQADDRLVLTVQVERDGHDWYASAREGRTPNGQLLGEAFDESASVARAYAIRDALRSAGLGRHITANNIPTGIDIRIVRARAKKAKG